MTTSAQIFHALRWNAVVRTTAQVCTWLITIFVMRLLSPVDYGLMSIATISQKEQGLSKLAIRNGFLNPQQVDDLFQLLAERRKDSTDGITF